VASQLLQKITTWLRGPQGKRAVTQARMMAQRPENRQRITALVRRLRGGRR
jgi:hypothetical protein